MSIPRMGYTECERGPDILEAVSLSETQTMAMGAALGRVAAPGLAVLLSGDLGAGKTVLAKGIARGLVIDPAEVTSPTFVLCREYAGRLPLYHFDLYRLGAAEDIYEIGWEEYLDGRGVTVVEWPDRLGELAPLDALAVVITGDGDAHTRRIAARAGGEGSLACLIQWRTAIGGMQIGEDTQ
jgi:tRNA threonylcarbamoyladenosine biosynthesis protein TsaE